MEGHIHHQIHLAYVHGVYGKSEKQFSSFLLLCFDYNLNYNPNWLCVLCYANIQGYHNTEVENVLKCQNVDIWSTQMP